MIDALIKASIHHKKTVLGIALLLSILGFYNAMHLSIDAIPDVTNVQVTAVTKSPGLSPLEIEQFITFPIEAEFTGLPKVQEIRSISRTGVSSVTVIFEDDMDVYFARQLVNERLKQAEALIPPGYGVPELSPVTTALGEIYEFALTSDRHTSEDLRTFMEWEIAKKIKSVQGIIDVNILGGIQKQYQIKLDPRRLQSHNLSLASLLERLKKSNINVGGGYIQKGQEQYVIRGESQFKSVEQLRKVAVKTEENGIPLLLGQVAEVTTGSALRFGTISMHGKGEVVGGSAMMLMGQNSRDVTARVKERIKEIEKNLPQGMKIENFYDRSEFIDRTLKTVFTNLTEAAVLVFLCLYFTLGSVKGATLVALAIPVSMLTATIFMRQLGIVGNLMSLGALDFGLLVDGSIVMLESILHAFFLKREFYESQITSEDKSIATQEIIMNASIKVARAGAFAVAIILLVYLPLMALEGVEGKMFRPMAMTVAIALAIALVYSLTVFPATVAFFFKEPVYIHIHFWDTLSEFYVLYLKKAMSRQYVFVMSGISIFIVSMMLGGTLGSEFLPRIDEGSFAIDVKRLPSTALDYSRDLNMDMEKVISLFPETNLIVSKMGRGESAAEPIGTDEGEIMVSLKPKKEWVIAKDREGLMDAFKERILSSVPGTYISLSQPIENRVNQLLAGSKADVVIKIYGDDLLELKNIAEKTANIIKPIPGAADLRVQRILGLPLLEIKANQEKMARFGVRSDEILATIEALRVGYNVGKVFEGFKRFDLVGLLSADLSNLDQIENIPISTINGSTVPLAQVADIKFVEGPAVVYRESLKRRIFVEMNVRGRDLVGFVNEAQEKTQTIFQNMPLGYEVDWGGQFENFTRARDRLILVVPIALSIIFFMLMIAFGSPYYAMGVFMVVPLSVSGGILALFFRGLPFSIPAGVGFIAASGIAVLNGVVYASTLKQLIEEGIEVSTAVISAASDSMRPVVTTELVALIGFLPMAVSTSAGAEVQRPLATVVIGGILVATVLSRFLLPIIMQYLILFEEKIKKKESTEWD
jgi:cobalt-zinc-cadmium resistance protein CzcA